LRVFFLTYLLRTAPQKPWELALALESTEVTGAPVKGVPAALFADRRAWTPPSSS